MAKQREFNITGPCVPSRHYMVDTDGMIDEIITGYVEPGKYFTLNRARQYGKTTTLWLLEKALASTYIPVRISFEGFGTSAFSSEDRFIRVFIQRCAQSLERAFSDADLLREWSWIDGEMDFPALDDKIARLTKMAGKKIVLMVDEVDKSSSNQLFLDFLGMLRNKYIERSQHGTPTFHCVILVGVHDIKNLKMKLRPGEEHIYNSPWNIAASFDVDMSFSTGGIATMLEAYEADHHRGMNIPQVSERLYYYTSGYPFLVSLLCKTIHEEDLSWTNAGVDEAENRILKINNTLFDDVIKNIVNHSSLGALAEDILLRGESVAFEVSDPAIDLGLMFGILKNKDGKASISNIVFETRILNYYIATSRARGTISTYVSTDQPRFVRNGKLDVELVLNRFAAFMQSEYRDEDGCFIEREYRLLFLSFLKPIINGIGHYAVEPETRGSRRMDVVVFYGGEEHIVELKIWRGEQATSEAYHQLIGYLTSRQQRKGYLLCFCDNRKTPRQGRALTLDGCEIIEVIVAYRDKE